MNKIRIILMLCFFGGIFLTFGDWANSQCPHHETPKETPAQAPVRTDVPTRPPSDSSRPVDSGQFDGVPKGKSNQADSDNLKVLSDIEKLEKQYLKQGDKKKDAKEDVPKTPKETPVQTPVCTDLPNEKPEPTSSDMLKVPSEKSSVEKPAKQGLKQVDKKKDTEKDVPKQSAQKAPWYSSIWNRAVNVYTTVVANNTNKSIAKKKTELERVNADVTGWDLELRKQSTDRYMDDAALGEGRDFKKKFVLNPNAQRKAISGQMDDTDGNIAAIKQERDKAKAKQVQLKKEIAGLEAKVATIQLKNKSVTPVSSTPSGGKPLAGRPSVTPSTGRSEREPATSGYAPPPRAR